MKKIYYLSTCDTCKRILEEIEAPSSFKLQDIKKNLLTLTNSTNLSTSQALLNPFSAKEQDSTKSAI